MELWPRESWTEAEPRRLVAERAAMPLVAPQLEWGTAPSSWLEGVGWEGLAPVWPFERERPPDLEAFLAGRRFRVGVAYPEAFPMVPPKIWPIDPSPDPRYRTQHKWHVNPDGSLCLMQAASDWTCTETASDLVVKAAGWFLEYLLMEAGIVDQMTNTGIANDPSLDHLFVGHRTIHTGGTAPSSVDS